MDKPPPFASALIAGGRSRRMGVDKAFLPWPDMPLWRVQMEKLRCLGPARLLLSGRKEQQWGALAEEELVADPEGEDRGPLHAIIRCMEHGRLPLLVMAVDMPGVTAEFLKRTFLDRLAQGSSVFLVRDGQWEPMLCLLQPAVLPHLRAEAAGRGSVQNALRAAAKAEACVLVEVDGDDTSCFTALNEPEHLLLHGQGSSERGLLRQRISRGGAASYDLDAVAAEEPLEIRVEGRSVAVVMRTPGHDQELAAGFLVSEGIAQQPRDILEVSQCPVVGDSKGNVVDVLLGGVVVDWEKLTRHIFSASSCGLCGKTSLDAVFTRFPAVAQASGPLLKPELLWELPGRLREAQLSFSKTGGLHACAVFDENGRLVVLREDVGRHNALDKVLGHGLMEGLLPWSRHILMLSGRVSFEMMQKALAAGVPVVAAISAPTSLAVSFAMESGQTLVGFLRPESMNVYTGGHRLLREGPATIAAA